MRDSSGKAAPPGTPVADWRAVMSAMGKESVLPDSADDPRVVELLAHWDELPEGLLQDLVVHPVHGPSLSRLREVESYLTGSACPEAQQLYDFARGPGYEPMPGALRQEVEDHLAHCAECEALVESLEGTPPLPLDLTGDATEVPRPQPTTILPRTVERWLPMAAAAAVLAIGMLVFRGGTVDAGDLWPDYPLLRGPASDALVFPRDRVLAPGSVPGGSWAAAPRFELAEVRGATLYRIVVQRNGGGAFADATSGDGSPLLELEAGLDDLISAQPLEPGHYTWEAWATVDGLESLLGERDFEVLEIDGMRAALLRRSDLERVHHLHEAGHWTDARAVTRRSPPSVGRDAYLGAVPGR